MKWDEEADVVVIGSGATGLPAAIVAAEAGASVIVVEAEADIVTCPVKAAFESQAVERLRLRQAYSVGIISVGPCFPAATFPATPRDRIPTFL